MFLLLSVAIGALIWGTAIGWYLRKKERWCGGCGGHLTCVSCEPVLRAVSAQSLPAGLSQSPLDT